MIEVTNTWERIGHRMVLFCPRRHLMESVTLADFERCGPESKAFAERRTCPGCQRPNRYGAVVGCSTCADIEVKYGGFGPPHFASLNCESGGGDHCACGTCF